MRWPKFLLLTLGILGVGWLLDHLFHLEENRVLGRIETAALAIERKDFEGLSACLREDFHFDSRSPFLGGGDLSQARSRLEDFWSRSGTLSVIWRSSEVRVENRLATVQAKGNLKFVGGEMGEFAFYQFQADLKLEKQTTDWKIYHVEIPVLAPWSF